MKINYLVLRNFRQYEHTRFNFHDKFTVLIGNNGTGKTTVLDALAKMLNTYFQGSRITTGGSVIKNEDARTSFYEEGGETFEEDIKQKDVFLEAQVSLYGNQPISWRREKGDRGAKAKDLVSMAAKQLADASNRISVDLPLMLYYGAGRLWDVHHDVDTGSPESKLDAYRYCLDPKSDQKAFEKWFKKTAFSQLQKGQSRPAITVVKNAVLACIPNATDFYHDTDLDRMMIKLGSAELIPFNSLSDGYRNVVAMVADIAYRAARLNPHFGIDSAKKATGIVLIDEIDLHLHPKWQRLIVNNLQEAFPNLQFIATTHSPFIIQSLSSGEIIDLDRKIDLAEVERLPLGIAAPGASDEFVDRSIEDILEGVMRVDLPQRSARLQQMYEVAKQYYQLLREAKSADEPRKNELKMALDKLSAPFSENVAYHAFLEIKRLTAGL